MVFLVCQLVCQLIGTVLVCWAWWITPSRYEHRPSFIYMTSWFALASIAVLIRRLVTVCDIWLDVPAEIYTGLADYALPLFVSVATVFIGSRLVRVAHGLDQRIGVVFGLAAGATLVSAVPLAHAAPVDLSDSTYTEMARSYP